MRDHGGGARGTATASGDGRIALTICRTESKLESGIVSDGQIWPSFAGSGRSCGIRSSLPVAR